MRITGDGLDHRACQYRENPGTGATMSLNPGGGIVVRPDEGARVRGMDMVHKVDAGRLEGGLLVMEGGLAAGGLIPPHTHTREDECSYVIAGEVMFQVGEDIVTATPGSYVIKPRGVPHAFWNCGSEVFSMDWSFEGDQDERCGCDGTDSLGTQADPGERFPPHLQDRVASFAWGA